MLTILCATEAITASLMLSQIPHSTRILVTRSLLVFHQSELLNNEMTFHRVAQLAEKQITENLKETFLSLLL